MGEDGLTFGRIARLIGVALLVMIANIAVSILYMVVYSYAIDPGHDEAYYQAHIQTAAPYSSIIAGIPLMFLAGWWVSLWSEGKFGVKPALIVWLAYAVIDSSIVLMAGATSTLAVLVVVSHLTKLLAAYLGASFPIRSRIS